MKGECREKCKKKKHDDKTDEDEEAMIDDTDKDKDYNPDDDPEADFVVEDQDMDDEDTFEVEKTCPHPQLRRSRRLPGIYESVHGGILENSEARQGRRSQRV